MTSSDLSKHAMESFLDPLAADLEKFDVAVGVVEPGNYNSAIGVSLKRRLERRGITGEGSLYEDDMKRIIERLHA